MQRRFGPFAQHKCQLSAQQVTAIDVTPHFLIHVCETKRESAWLCVRLSLSLSRSLSRSLSLSLSLFDSFAMALSPVFVQVGDTEPFRVIEFHPDFSVSITPPEIRRWTCTK